MDLYGYYMYLVFLCHPKVVSAWPPQGRMREFQGGGVHIRSLTNRGGNYYHRGGNYYQRGGNQFPPWW